MQLVKTDLAGLKNKTKQNKINKKDLIFALGQILYAYVYSKIALFRDFLKSLVVHAKIVECVLLI